MDNQAPIQPKGTPINLETADVWELRHVLEVIIGNLRGPDAKPATREKAIAVTKLQEARFWLGEQEARNA